MIRWGLIGGSDIAATRMIPAMPAAGQRPVAVASSSHRRAQQFADAHGIDDACPDVDDLLARDDIDAVYISSLNHLHAPHTLAAAAAGRHVLCEKPVALDLADTDLSPAVGPLPEDAAMAVVRYPGEVMCRIDVGSSTPFARNGLEVDGTTGSLVATDVICADPGGSVVLVNEQGRQEVAFARHRDAYLVTLESFERAVAQGSEPMVTGREGALALALTLAVGRAGSDGAIGPIAV